MGLCLDTLPEAGVGRQKITSPFDGANWFNSQIHSQCQHTQTVRSRTANLLKLSQPQETPQGIRKSGSGAIWNADSLEPPVIPVKAGIQSDDSAFPKACGVDSRFRGNDCIQFSLTSLLNDPLFHVFGPRACSFKAFFVSFRAIFRFVFWTLLLIPQDLLGSFRLNSIFFAFLANSLPPAGQFQTHPRALSSGRLHKSTYIGYHIPFLVSSGKYRMQDSGFRAEKSEGGQEATALRGSPAREAPTDQAPHGRAFFRQNPAPSCVSVVFRQRRPSGESSQIDETK